jgi:flagellar operon protein
MTEPIRIQVQRTSSPLPATSQPARPPHTTGPNFAQKLAEVQQVRFSNHAQKRLETRDIHLSQDNVNRLSNAIDKAEKRGGVNSLVLMDEMAFIVNVHDRLVVTAMDTNQRGEGVFTQIDSVVIANPAEPRESVEANQ